MLLPPEKSVQTSRLELQDQLLHFLSAGVGKAAVLPDDHEAVLLQHPDGTQVVFGHPGEDRALTLLLQEQFQRPEAMPLPQYSRPSQ